jgi:hypothetical protein
MTGAIPQVWSVGPLPTVADIRSGEILSGCTGVRDRPTCVKTLYTLVHVAFFRISEMVEDCMCGTTLENRVTIPRTAYCSVAATKTKSVPQRASWWGLEIRVPAAKP